MANASKEEMKDRETSSLICIDVAAMSVAGSSVG